MAANEFVAYLVTQFAAAVVAGLLVRYVGGEEPHGFPQGWKSTFQRVVVGSILLSLKYFNAPGWYGTL